MCAIFIATSQTREVFQTHLRKSTKFNVLYDLQKMQNFSSFKRPWSFKQALEIEVKNNWLKSKRLPNLKNLKIYQLFFAMEDNNVKLIKIHNHIGIQIVAT